MSPVWPTSRSISLVHLPLTFFINPLPAIQPPASLPLLSSPDTTTWEPTSVEYYLKWRETCFLSTWLEDSFKGKVLLYNVWKFYTRSFSHWRATTLWIIITGFSQYLSKGYKTGFRRFSHIYLLSYSNNISCLQTKLFCWQNISKVCSYLFTKLYYLYGTIGDTISVNVLWFLKKWEMLS